MFSKKPADTPRILSVSPMAGSTFSVLGADMAIKGDVTATADLHIDGRIEGDVNCTALVQGEHSEIIGSITAETARLAGIVRGSIVAGQLVILRNARIHGDVHYDALTIEQGAQVDGRFAHRAVQPVNGTSEPHLTLAS